MSNKKVALERELAPACFARYLLAGRPARTDLVVSGDELVSTAVFSEYGSRAE